MLIEVFAYKRQFFILSHQNGDVVCVYIIVYQLLDTCLQTFQIGFFDVVRDAFVPIVCVQFFYRMVVDIFHSDITQFVVFLWCLVYIAVSNLEDRAVYFCCIGIGKFVAHLLEEVIVEVDDVLRRTEIVFCWNVTNIVFQVFVLFDVVEDLPVRVAETVDTLLHIAHYQTTAIAGNTVENEWLEVLPLQCRRVLKLINHDVLDDGASLFVDEWYVLFVDDIAKEIGSLGKEETVVLVVKILDRLAYFFQKEEMMKVLGYCLNIVNMRQECTNSWE